MSSDDRAVDMPGYQSLHADAEDLQQTLVVLQSQLSSVGAEDVPAEVVQYLMTMGVKSYCALREGGHDVGPFVHEDAVSATEAMVAAANILHAADIEVFELGMWMVRGSG